MWVFCFKHIQNDLFDKRSYCDLCVFEYACCFRQALTGHIAQQCVLQIHAARKTSAWKYLRAASVCSAGSVFVCGRIQYVSKPASVSSYQNQYQAGLSRWCSCRWKGVCGSCCPQRRPWRWTEPGAHHLRFSNPTSWPPAGHSGRSQPLCSGVLCEPECNNIISPLSSEKSMWLSLSWKLINRKEMSSSASYSLKPTFYLDKGHIYCSFSLVISQQFIYVCVYNMLIS